MGARLKLGLKNKKLNELRGKFGIVLDSDIDEGRTTIDEILKYSNTINMQLCQSSEELLKKLNSEERIDFIISEYKVRKLHINGIVRLCESCGKTIPVILLTKNLTDREAATYLNNGVSAYLLKDRLESLPPILNATLKQVKIRELSLFNLEKLRSESQNLKLIDDLSVGIYRIDNTGRCVFVNSKCCEITGLSQQEALGKGYLSRIHPEDQMALIHGTSSSINSNFTSINSDVARKTKFRFIKPDGVEVWMTGVSQPEKDINGHIIGRIGTLLDISKKEELNREFQNLSDVLGQINNFATITDKDNNILWVNKGFEKITGCKSKDVINKSLPEFLKSKGSTPDSIYEINKNRTSRTPFTIEIINHKKQASPYWLSLSITPILDSNEQVDRYICIGTDISQRIQDKIELENQVSLRTAELMETNTSLEDVNENFSDSISYAERIQKGVLPDLKILNSCFKDAFVFLKPRDVISGDFYWFHPVRDGMVIVAADCTGHGVPGAFMSLIGINLLNKYVVDNGIKHPSDILESLDDGLSKLLDTNGKQRITDGMDISICTIDKKRQRLQFAGAGSPMVLIADNQLFYKKGSPYGLGNHMGDGTKQFETFSFNYCPGDMVYIFSDGFVDQFGGDKGKKLMRTRFKQMLLDVHKKPAHIQRNELEHKLALWMKDEPQIDDILTIGMRLE